VNTINRDTKIYGSLSERAGSKGCEFFNAAFQKHNINAIYKSFSIQDIAKALSSIQCLGFSGCAVSMPFKAKAFNLVDFVDDKGKLVGNINTIIVKEGKLFGYNTDYIAAVNLIEKYNQGFNKLYILGRGGLASSVKAAASELNLETTNITRDNWNEIETLKNSFIFNCTPVTLIPHESNVYIDCLVGTKTGDEFHSIQAKNQFKIYTGLDYE
jgi:shikimate dehydrogenase